MKHFLFLLLAFSSSQLLIAQDADQLIQKVKAKIERVTDYQAAGVMKTNVPFLKVPVADVTVYFKKPDKLKIKNEKGLSLVPKGAVSMSLSNLMAGKKYQAIPAGKETVNGRNVSVIKLLPLDNNAEVVLSTLYIDEPRLLVVKAVTTTRENGTYQLEMEYGRFADYALPAKAVFTFNTKEYKLPKGVTFDYDDGSNKKKSTNSTGSNKGSVEITYNNYIINKGVPDSVFQ
jgi:outer membrane lipoprotein-sorting protein